MCEIEREKERNDKAYLSIHHIMEVELFMLKTLMGFLNDSLTNLLLRNNILECNKFEMKALFIYDRGGRGGGERVYGKFESGGV